MEFLQAIVLGIIEGITEFLPVSSTGHLIIAESFFGFSDKVFADTFMVVIQSGAIFAVILVYWKRFLPLGREQTQETKQAALTLWAKTIVGFIPFAVLALILNKTIKSYLFFPIPVALALVFWGMAIIGIEWWQKRSAKAPLYQRPEEFPYTLVLLIGLFQCLALWPGTSRSAATIVGAMLLGTSRVAAAEFSFFMAIPTLLSAGAYDLLDGALEGTLVFSTNQWIALALGTLVSFLVALGVIGIFMNFIRKQSFTGFGIYRIILGVLIILGASLLGVP